MGSTCVKVARSSVGSPSESEKQTIPAKGGKTGVLKGLQQSDEAVLNLCRGRAVSFEGRRESLGNSRSVDRVGAH